jgi:hypothetical protein
MNFSVSGSSINFFLLPEQWQREYRPLLAAWFVRQHEQRIAALDRDSWRRK